MMNSAEPRQTANAARWARQGFLLLLLLFASFGAFCKSKKSTADAVGEPVVLVAAASDLVDVFGELGTRFNSEEKGRVVFSFGSSGLLARQIEQGAPFDVYASASLEYVERLEKQNLASPATRQVFALGRIALWQQSDSSCLVSRLQDLTIPCIKRVAMANPEHAPYGKAARQALQQAGLWEAVHDKVVLAENVSQALQFARTGNVDVAIVALSLGLKPGGRYVVVDGKLHQPIEQTVCILRRTTQESLAHRWVVFLQRPASIDVLKRYGYLVGGESNYE